MAANDGSYGESRAVDEDAARILPGLLITNPQSPIDGAIIESCRGPRQHPKSAHAPNVMLM